MSYTTKLPRSSLCRSPLSSHLYSPPSSSLFHLNPHTLSLLSLLTFLIIIIFPSLSSSQNMKLLTNINPKKIFRSKKSRSVSRSNTSSFSSSDSSSDGSDLSKPKSNGLATPTSVLPAQPDLLWSQIAEGVNLELNQAFKIIDGDGDGKITKSELTALLTRVGAEPISEEEVDLMLSEVDRENDGSISLEKLGSIGSAFEPAPCQAELLETFKFFDTDHDGKITAEELLNVFSSIGDGRCTLEDCRRMISGVDKNGDGFVCFEDFARMMEPHLYT